MKLPKGIEVHVGQEVYVNEIPDDVASNAGMAIPATELSSKEEKKS